MSFISRSRHCILLSVVYFQIHSVLCQSVSVIFRSSQCSLTQCPSFPFLVSVFSLSVLFYQIQSVQSHSLSFFQIQFVHSHSVSFITRASQCILSQCPLFPDPVSAFSVSGLLFPDPVNAFSRSVLHFQIQSVGDSCRIGKRHLEIMVKYKFNLGPFFNYLQIT